MAWTKAKKAEFEAAYKKTEDYLPKELVPIQTSMFEDVVEHKDNWQKLRFQLIYPRLDSNPKGDPVPKQSFKEYFQRYKKDDPIKGKRKGDLVLVNQNGLLTPITIKYPSKGVVETTNALQAQIKYWIEKSYPNFKMFLGPVFVTRVEFVFTPLANTPKYIMDDLYTGKHVYFKDTKPDDDNLEKLLWDAFEGIVYDNDSRKVSKNGIFKRYGIKPGVIVELEGEV